jgi:hypothetical protein
MDFERVLDIYSTLRLWFNLGWADVCLPIAIASAGSSVMAVLILKGISTPFLLLAAAGILIIGGTIAWGSVQEKIGVNSRMNNRINQKQNPIILNMVNEVSEIKKDINELKELLKEKTVLPQNLYGTGLRVSCKERLNMFSGDCPFEKNPDGTCDHFKKVD